MKIPYFTHTTSCGVILFLASAINGLGMEEEQKKPLQQTSPSPTNPFSGEEKTPEISIVEMAQYIKEIENDISKRSRFYLNHKNIREDYFNVLKSKRYLHGKEYARFRRLQNNASCYISYKEAQGLVSNYIEEQENLLSNQRNNLQPAKDAIKKLTKDLGEEINHNQISLFIEDLLKEHYHGTLGKTEAEFYQNYNKNKNRIKLVEKILSNIDRQIDYVKKENVNPRIERSTTIPSILEYYTSHDLGYKKMNRQKQKEAKKKAEQHLRVIFGEDGPGEDEGVSK